MPFAVDMLTHAVSFFLLMFIRLPAPPERREPVGRLGQEIAVGFRWVWRHRPVRVIGLFAVVLNLFFAAYFIVIIVVAQARGVSSGCRHYGGDVRCRWDPWRPGRPLPAAEGHSLCLDRRGVLGSDGCHSAGSLRQQCLSAGIAIRWYGISRPDCGHHDRYLPTSAHTRRNARQDDREQLSGVGYPPSLVRGGCADTAARPGQIASANL